MGGGVLWPQGRTIWLLVLPLCWAGCSRPGQQPAPLREGSNSSGSYAQPEATSGADSPNSGADVPFGDPKSLPAGTLLTVRLKDPVSPDSPGLSGTFTAIVDEPVVVEGATLLPRGAGVAGRIESSRSSTGKGNHGYVRLTLDLVDVAGHDLPIRTSSLFARGNAAGGPHIGRASHSVSLEQGRRLTFRLTEPVYLASRSSSIVPR